MCWGGLCELPLARFWHGFGGELVFFGGGAMPRRSETVFEAARKQITVLFVCVQALRVAMTGHEYAMQ